MFGAPAVIFWARFDDRLHAFDHRKTTRSPCTPSEDVTRVHILNHILGSFDDYKIQALSGRRVD